MFFIPIGQELWLLWQLIVPIDIMGKEEIDNFFCLIGDIWIFFTEMFLSSPLPFIRLLSKSVNLIGCRRGKKGQFS